MDTNKPKLVWIRVLLAFVALAASSASGATTNLPPSRIVQWALGQADLL